MSGNAFASTKLRAPPALSVAWTPPQVASVERLPRTRDAAVIRLVDVVLASAALLLLAPLFLLIALAIKLEDGGPVFYMQRRLGRGGGTFGCLKFRSMVPDANERLRELLESSSEARAEWADGQKLRNDPRITRIGRQLRRSSLDELPQLINVIRGEMSLVGPRPIVEGEIVRYGWRFATYCGVRPGITGLWQVSGRNDTTYRRRVALDHRFVRLYGLPLYLKILFATVPAVLLRRGSY